MGWQITGGQWLPDVKELAGGADEWQQAGDAPLRITWDQVHPHSRLKSWTATVFSGALCCNMRKVMYVVHDL